MPIRTLLCWLITLSFAPLAWCAEDDKPEIWYQVELIVFEQADMYGDEQPSRNIKLAYPENSRELVVPGVSENEGVASNDANSEQGDTEINDLPDLADELSSDIIGPQPEAASAQELPFVQLDSSLHLLTSDKRALNRRDNYKVLYHQAWRQPGSSRRRTPWVLVRGGQQFGDHYELEGSIRLYKSRFLHIETNLWFTRFAEQISPAGVQMRDVNLQSNQPGWPKLPDYPVVPESDPPAYTFGTPPPSRFSVDRIYTLNTSRKLDKTGQLHYLDHPNLGVLVQVTRYQVPTPEQEGLIVPDIDDEMDDAADDDQPAADQDR